MKRILKPFSERFNPYYALDIAGSMYTLFFLIYALQSFNPYYALDIAGSRRVL